MSFDPRAIRPAEGPPCVLVVDDDKRVLELLEVAFTAHGFRVLTVSDGDEALRRVASERPDLVVLDIRLPKKNGLDVCEQIRRHPEDADLPVIVVSATVETEMRLQAFRRGADDFVTKPFSPKELVARVRRLLARTGAAARAEQRTRDLERELERARGESARAHAEAQRERGLREIAFGFGLELQRERDPDVLARRVLHAVRTRFGLGVAALLAPAPPDGAFLPLAVRGDELDRVAGLAVAPAGELARFVAAIGRPVRRREIEALPELRAELPPLVAAGAALVVPLRGPAGLEGLIVTDERRDGRDLTSEEIERLRGLGEIAAVAMRNALSARAQADAALAALAARAASGPAADAREEALDLVLRAARATLLPPRERALLAHGARLGSWGVTIEAESALETIARAGERSYPDDLRRLMRRAHGLEACGPECPPEESRAATLLAFAWTLADARHEGMAPDPALARALDAVRPDAATRQSLVAAAREAGLPAGDVTVG
jgi:DNA-binding response OmpR family regulator/GAF domain-containing protein